MTGAPTSPQPRVSILIPCYNAAAWVTQTLESALAQTWPHKEILVVDDGSRDNSREIVRRYESRGVRLIEQPNSGASAARNRAIAEAKGDYLQFLDADDLISPDKLATQLAALRGDTEKVASCAWGRFTTDPMAAVFADEVVCHDFAPIDFLVRCSEGFMMHPSAWLVPRALAQRAGPWNETLTLNDDGEYFCRVLLAGKGIVFVPGPRSFYRSGLPGSLSQRRDERSRRSQFRSVELIAERLLAAEDSPRTRRAVANYFQRFIHDFFPAPADLMDRAAANVAGLGGSDLPPPMGPKTALLARVLGWKTVWRLKHWMQR
jgi:glycosyltransferase involved in cell wall biosynthesis